MHIHSEPNYGVSKNHMSQKRAELIKTQKDPDQQILQKEDPVSTEFSHLNFAHLN